MQATTYSSRSAQESRLDFVVLLPLALVPTERPKRLVADRQDIEVSVTKGPIDDPRFGIPVKLGSTSSH